MGLRRVSALAAAVALFALLAATASTSPPPLSATVNPWALQNEDPSANQVAIPQSQADTDARNFNYITAHAIAYASDIAGMKAANPKLEVLLYINGTFAQNYQPPTPPGSGGFDPSWYEKDAGGHYIVNPKSGNYLMNPTSSGWIQNQTRVCRNLPTGYAGCYLDALGLAPLAAGYLSGYPVNPSTGKPWTKPDWLKATAGLAAQIRAAASPLLVFANGLANGPFFFNPAQPTKQIVDGIDGGVAESWLRLSGDPVTQYPTSTAWKQDVDMLAAVEAEGKPLLTLTKLWSPATAGQRSSWQQFSLATFLLGTQGRSSFFFSPSPTTSRTTTYPLYRTNVGKPNGPYRFAQGVYQRVFTNGLVVVNPDMTTVTVRLSKPYYNSSHQQVSSIVAKPHTGAILTSS